jgi:hypothetical protein
VGHVPTRDVVPMEEEVEIEKCMGYAFITNQYSHVLQNLRSQW